MTETQSTTTEEITTEDPPTEMVARIEELENMVYDLQDRLEELEMDGREREMHNQFNGGF